MDAGTLLLKSDLARFRRNLLRWYGRSRRDLPWRKTRDPYRIWVSEIMLQQTRVAAVLEHYDFFLKKFPNVRALASSTEAAVLAAWSGLGYYRRARMMLKCAQEISERHDGRFPENAEELHNLPGIGRYTASAIASIAFGEKTAVVDGNLERVVQRISGRKLTLPEIRGIAQELISARQPGDFNQAMMELGATVCVPGQPRCGTCPVPRWCVAKGEIALDNPRTLQRRKQIWCGLERRDGHIRLRQRSKNESLMSSMWELPQSEIPPVANPDSQHWRSFRHSITNTDYTVHVLRTSVSAKRGKWIAIRDIGELPITGLTRKILRADGII